MTKTEKLKNIILSKYGSIREFSRIVEIPSTTLTSALDRDIGGMAVDRVIKICDILNLNVKTFEPLDTYSKEDVLSKEETMILSNFSKLNDLGKSEANKRVSELTEISKYIKISDATELITATKDEPNVVLKDMFTTIAAHDDDLTEDEKNEADRRILEALIKMKK